MMSEGEVCVQVASSSLTRPRVFVCVPEGVLHAPLLGGCDGDVREILHSQTDWRKTVRDVRDLDSGRPGQ